MDPNWGHTPRWLLQQLGDAVREQMVSDGHATDHMLTLQDARACLSTTSYDLILLDMMLPDGNCLTLLDKFPTQTKNRTLIITANPTVPSVIEAIHKGAVNYLEKPVDPKVLLKTLDDLVT